MAKTALVVDDSRTAQVGLSRLLKARGLVVETAESGPEAIDYLRVNLPPGVIFLDHMMPGMDGFEALSELKANERTAKIPVVMYTSKEGESYGDEARVRGAIGVLPKPPEPAELDRILAALRLQAIPTVAESVRVVAPATFITSAPASAPAAAVLPPSVPVASTPPPFIAAPPANVDIDTPPISQSPRSWSYVALCVLLAALAWWSYDRSRQAEQSYERTLADNARLKNALARLDEQTKVLPLATPSSTSRPEISRAYLDLLSWALNQSGSYDYAEIPFSDERLNRLRDLLAHLAAAGFRGTVRLEAHVGRFCLARDESGMHVLPPRAAPLSVCETMSYPPGEAVALGRRQSEAFSRFLSERAMTRVLPEVMLVSYGTSRPLLEYPDPLRVSTAGDWNDIARLNQRVEVVLAPAPTSAANSPR
ncbi:MAG: response regulator [Gammaproteobacteria bacterium]|nr:response regulator [Gammaproteobacteria bacterium]